MTLHTSLLGILPGWKNAQVHTEVAMSAFLLGKPSDFFLETPHLDFF